MANRQLDRWGSEYQCEGNFGITFGNVLTGGYFREEAFDPLVFLEQYLEGSRGGWSEEKKVEFVEKINQFSPWFLFQYHVELYEMESVFTWLEKIADGDEGTWAELLQIISKFNPYYLPELNPTQKVIEMSPFPTGSYVDIIWTCANRTEPHIGADNRKSCLPEFERIRLLGIEPKEHGGDYMIIVPPEAIALMRVIPLKEK